MTTNENVHRMRAQILNLRSAGITCGTAIHCFPPCGRPGGDHRQCPEARAAMQPIYEGMNELLLSVIMALTAVFHPDPDLWDFLWEVHEDSTCTERDLAAFAELMNSDQDMYIRFCGEMDADMMEKLVTSFSKEEWEVLTAKGAWKTGDGCPRSCSF